MSNSGNSDYESNDSSNESDQMITNQTEAQQNFVTYVIGSGNEILIHRFEIDIEDGQDIEAVIKNLDDQMEAINGKIIFRIDWFKIQFIVVKAIRGVSYYKRKLSERDLSRDWNPWKP